MAEGINRRINIFVNGKEVEDKIGAVKAAFDRLNREIKQCTIGSEEYNKKIADIQKAKAILDEHNKQIKGIATGWDTVKEKIGKYFEVFSIAAASAAVMSFFKSGIDKAITFEEQLEKLNFALREDAAATKRMTDFANELSKTSLFPRGKIIEAETMALGLGRTEEQTKKMVIAAMALSRIVPNTTLDGAITLLNGTLGGATKMIERYVPEIKNLTAEQFASGKAIDFISEKFGRFATSGLDSTHGKIIMLEKGWNKLKMTSSQFAVETIGSLAVSLKKTVDWLQNNTSAVHTFLKITGIAAVALATYTLVVNGVAWAKKAYTVATEMATAATKAFNNVTKMNPFAAIMAALVAAGTAYIAFRDNVNAATKALNEFKAHLNEDIGTNNSLFEQLKKTNIASTERLSIITQIKEKFGGYLQGMNLETASLEDIEAAQRKVNAAIIENILIEEKAKAIKNYATSQTEILVKLKAKDMGMGDIMEQMKPKDSNTFVYQADKDAQLLIESYIQMQKEIDNIGKTYDEISNNYKTSFATIGKVVDVEKDKQKELQRLRALTTAQLQREEANELEIEHKLQIQKVLKEKENAKTRAEKREEQDKAYHQLKIDTMEDGYKKEKAIEYEQNRANLVKYADSKKLLEMEAKRHTAALKKIDLTYYNWMREHTGKTEIEIENSKYKKEIGDFYMHVKNKTKLSKTEIAALESLKYQHQQKMDKLDANAYSKEIERLMTENKSKYDDMKLAHTSELNAITTMEQAKAFLKNTFSEKELKKIKTLAQARKEIEKIQLNEEIKLQEKSMTELLAQLQQALSSGIMSGVNLADKLLSKEESAVLVERINTLKEELAKLKEKLKGTDESEKNTDLLDKMFNTTHAKDKLAEIESMATKVGDIWGSLLQMQSNAEEKEMRTFKLNQNTKKALLDKQLKSGFLTQTKYDEKIAALDAETEQRQKQMDYDQAKRQKTLSIFNIITSTAAAIMQTYNNPGGFFNLPLALSVAAAGAAQLGVAISTPLPELDAGGYTNGISIAGEKRKEWVASNDLLTDKKTAPVISWLENYQRGNKNAAMPTIPNFQGMQNAINSKYQAINSNTAIHINTENQEKLLLIMIEHQKINIEETRTLNKYLSNPDNRKARIVRDELSKFDKELSAIQSLARIK